MVLLLSASFFLALGLFGLPLPAALLVFESFLTMSLAEALGDKSYREYMIARFTQKLIQICLSIPLYLLWGINAVFIGFFTSYAVFSYRFFWSLLSFRLKLNSLGSKLNFAVHSYLIRLTDSLAAYLDKLLIGILLGLSALGLYQLSYQFFMLSAILPSSLFRYLLPEEAKGSDKGKIKRLGVLASITLTVSIITFSPAIIDLLFPNFREATPMVRLMSLAMIPTTFVSIHRAELLGGERSRPAVEGNLIYIVVEILGIVTLGAMWSLVGMALSVILAFTANALYLHFKTH